ARRYEEENPSVERGIVNLFMGIGFIIAGMAVMMKFPGGFTWGWALFIPGFSCLGRGVASVVGARAKHKHMVAGTTTLNSITNRTPLSQPTSPFLVEPQVRDTGQMRPAVPSVTEGTTRHLGTEAQTKHFDSIENQKPS